MNWRYEKLDEDGKLISLSNFTNDTEGKYTGRIVINAKAWFDENPDEWKARGWTKHLMLDDKEIKERYPHNKYTQYLLSSIRQVDEYTVEDVYYVMDKSEEQMLQEELNNEWWEDDINAEVIRFN